MYNMHLTKPMLENSEWKWFSKCKSYHLSYAEDSTGKTILHDRVKKQRKAGWLTRADTFLCPSTLSFIFCRAEVREENQINKLQGSMYIIKTSWIHHSHLLKHYIVLQNTWILKNNATCFLNLHVPSKSPGAFKAMVFGCVCVCSGTCVPAAWFCHSFEFALISTQINYHYHVMSLDPPPSWSLCGSIHWTAFRTLSVAKSL